jgi:hypothetical protein
VEKQNAGSATSRKQKNHSQTGGLTKQPTLKQQPQPRAQTALYQCLFDGFLQGGSTPHEAPFSTRDERGNRRINNPTLCRLVFSHLK